MFLTKASTWNAEKVQERETVAKKRLTLEHEKRWRLESIYQSDRLPGKNANILTGEIVENDSFWGFFNYPD